MAELNQVPARALYLRTHLAALAKQVPAQARLRDGLAHGAMAMIAALIAYLPTREIGLREGFWAAITAISVVQTRFDATRNTARDQFAGAAIGAVIGGSFATLFGGQIWTYAISVMVAILVCWAINVASAARLAAVTATIILLVPHQGPVTAMVLARVGEVAWGVCCAIAIVWLTERLSHRAS